MFKITNTLKLKCDCEFEYLPYFNTFVIKVDDMEYQSNLRYIQKNLKPLINYYLNEGNMHEVNKLEEYQKQFDKLFSSKNVDTENKAAKKELVDKIHKHLNFIKTTNSFNRNYSSDKDELLGCIYDYKERKLDNDDYKKLYTLENKLNSSNNVDDNLRDEILEYSLYLDEKYQLGDFAPIEPQLCQYKHLELYTIDHIISMIRQANKIGECVYQLLNKIFKSNPQRLKYELKLKDNSEDVKKSISNDPYYRYLLISAYNDKYTSKYVKLEVDDYFLLNLNNFYYYNEKTKEMQWYDYKNDNINEVYEKIQIEHEKELKELESTIVYNLHFNDISQTIIKALMSQFNENRTLYKKFTNLIASFINKFGLPNFAQPYIEYNEESQKKIQQAFQNIKKAGSSLSLEEKLAFLDIFIYSGINDELKNKGRRNDLLSFTSFKEYELNNSITAIFLANDEIEINSLNINLNDFIQTCFIIYILIELKKPTPKEKKDEILLTILSQSFHLHDYTTEDILHLLKEHNIFDMIDTTHINRTELPKNKEDILEIKTDVENYKVKIGVYSCIHDCLFDIFMKLYNKKGNLKLQQEHAFQCAKCHEFYFTKGHVIKNINISKYKVYLCDDCFNDREKKLAQKRKQKFNENKKNVHS